MVANFHPPKPIPTAPLGQRLHELFGRNLWDFIEAPALAPGQKPQWRTITDYPLRPRLLWQRWKDLTTLIGVRFDGLTTYALIDLDVESPYCNAEALAQLRAALETIGITSTIPIVSSHSQGLHLYLPLPELVKTFDLAVALETCLKAQGFTLANGTLEIFPNPKPYGVEKIIHYNGHRLPLQPGTGSYLLDDDLNPIGDRLEQFFSQWDDAASHQDMDELRLALKVGRENRRKKPKRAHSPSSTTALWRQDLDAEIEEGWSGHGQTNHLLKTVACYGRVFLGLSGDELFTHTLETVPQLPGYRQYCRHQHEIERKVKAWCKAVESRYVPLTSQQAKPDANQQRAEDAQERIVKAIATLKDLGELPSKIRDLAQQLTQAARCGLKTLYKHLELWHPSYTQAATERCETVEPEGSSAGLDSPSSPQTAHSRSSSDPPNPDSARVFHTQERSMKCRETMEPSSFKQIPPKRGVRGENRRSPQPQTQPQSTLRIAGNTATVINQEVWAAIQGQVHILGWSLKEVRSFLRSHFAGRDRIWQLSEAELETYLYYLRVENLKHV
ncbi:MAG: hypothetical protein F6K00_35015 [Leptolyngbya sp. SIOISBB]|nr:hypothetical protein [Leptolyngbya sp. SIOISBB]